MIRNKIFGLVLPFLIAEHRTVLGPGYNAACCSAELCIMHYRRTTVNLNFFPCSDIHALECAIWKGKN
jgi:hypothetical protein